MSLSGLSGLSGMYGGSTLLNGLVAYWKLDEVSGTRIDVVGGNNLTDNNTVTQNPGKVGNAAQFTAANSEYLLKSSDSALPTGDTSFAYSLWCYLDSKSARRGLLLKSNNASTINQTAFWLDYDSSADRFRAVIGDAANAAYTVATANNLGSPSTATWYYVYGYHNPSADLVGVSINAGTPNTTSTGGKSPASGSFNFYVGSQGIASYMDGSIDDLKCWTRLLTAAEIAEDYANGLAGRSLV